MAGINKIKALELYFHCVSFKTKCTAGSFSLCLKQYLQQVIIFVILMIVMMIIILATIIITIIAIRFKLVAIIVTIIIIVTMTVKIRAIVVIISIRSNFTYLFPCFSFCQRMLFHLVFVGLNTCTSLLKNLVRCWKYFVLNKKVLFVRDQFFTKIDLT